VPRLELDGDLAVVTLDRPDKLNALDPSALGELDRAYRDAEDAGVRALLLRAEGRAFCAGRDIQGVTPEDDDVIGYLDGLVQPLLRRMSAFPAPTFAAVQGAALGVGLGLLIATDVVYVAASAKIGSPFANLGAALDSGGHALFFERLGAHKTLDLIYTGRLMSGTEAVQSGLFSRVVDDDELQDATEAAARAASAGATQAFRAGKALVAALRDERLGLWESMSRESRAQTELGATSDYREGFAAFQEKRPPSFTGD
jgi:2-(1,2-epoxy-1,2-dihydrophenyl)acetyl-CoA isomerase